jgi:hypothetical protein
MRLPIELIAILVLAGVFLLWLLYLVISKWWIARRYNPDNDKSRRNGEDTSRANPPTPESAGIVPEPSEVTERSSIPDVLAGKIRQDSSRLRNLLRRTKDKE